MAAQTLFADDKETLVSGLDQWSKTKNIRTIAFASTAREAMAMIASGEYARVITDLVFEGETQDGIALLERAKDRYPRAELFLLTQKSVSTEQRARLERIGAIVIKKSALGWGLMELMLSGAALGNLPMSEEDVDIGELKLVHETLQGEYEELRSLNDLLIDDILWELDRVPTRGDKTMIIGQERFSVADLRHAVLTKSAIGIKLIRLHHGLYRKLRERR